MERLQVTTSARTMGGAAKEAANVESASALIDARINQLGDWRGKLLAEMRALILETNPEIVEEWKWSEFPYGPTMGSCARERRIRASSK